MDLEEAVSKGQCIVTLAQQRSWSHILPLLDLSTLLILGEQGVPAAAQGRGSGRIHFGSWPLSFLQLREM